MADTAPPAPEIDPAREEAGWRVSPVWLVPLLALVVALAVAWQTYSQRGPTIRIVFDSAAGVEAGQTAVRFRDVQVGVVERVDLSSDLKQVVVTARINKDVARFVDGDAKFWVVRPTVSAQGVSGIETVISGVYIGASWDDKPGPREELFQGLPRPPQTPAGTAGIRLELHAPDGGSMAVGAPVLYKRIKVGQVEDIELTDAGDVTIEVFINAPNQKFVTMGTRFWNASGFSIDLGGGGASLNVDSLLSLLQGGISFDTVGPDTAAPDAGHVFELYPSENAARRNLFEAEPGDRLMLDARFDGSVQGLEPGAVVRYHGLDVGEVTRLQAVVVGEGEGRRLALQTTLALVPPRLGIHGGDEPKQTLDFIDGLVARGLRARLASTGLLTTTLYVELVDLHDAPPAGIDTDAKPFPILPSVPSDATSLTASAQGLMARLSSLPLEDVVTSAVNLIDSANALISSPEVRSAPENLGALIADLRETVDSSGIKEAPAQVAAILASAKALVDQAGQAQLVRHLDETLATAKAAIASIGSAADGVPALIEQVNALSAKANALPLDQLVASATQLVDGLDAFVKSQDVANIPGSVAASLDELRGAIADLRTGGAIDNVNATLASVRAIADQAKDAELVARLTDTLATTRETVAGIGTATAGVPAVVDQIEALSKKANALPLDQLVASASDLVASLDALVKSEGVTNLPASVNASLDQLRAVVAELQGGGAIDNVNATLASVRQMTEDAQQARLVDSLREVIAQAKVAVGSVSTATEDLPGLIASLNTLSANAAKLPLDQLVTTATQTLNTADSFLASNGVADVPPKLAASLEELRGLLAELRQGGAVANVNATLASADRAADAITTAAADLPTLITRLNTVAERADAALSTVGPDSKTNRDLILVLQEVRDAARSINALAQALQRQPNSVIFGR
ncbi:MAG: MlaD family protein [Amaricoccus sp.]